MRLREISYALKAAADVAHAGEQLVGSLDRTRSRGFVLPVLLGVGVGVGLGALLFSESARERVSTWLFGPRVAPPPSRGETVDTTAEETVEPDVEASSAPH